MVLHTESFYCMYFSQQENGQSIDCEHVIGLAAGEEEEEGFWCGGECVSVCVWAGGSDKGNKDM